MKVRIAIYELDDDYNPVRSHVVTQSLPFSEPVQVILNNQDSLFIRYMWTKATASIPDETGLNGH